MKLCVKNTQIINDSVHCADKLEVVKKIAQEKRAENDKLRSEIAEKEKKEAELQRKHTGMFRIKLWVKSIHVIKGPVHHAGELKTMKKIAWEKSAKVDKLQSDIAEKESTEAELQQKLTDIEDDKTQLKVSLQKKESECVPDESMCEVLTNNQRLCNTMQVS